jgi:hypothetical protein
MRPVRSCAGRTTSTGGNHADHRILAQEVGSTVGVAIEEVDAAIEALPDDSQLIDAVLDVERGLGTWADVVALARKLA